MIEVIIEGDSTTRSNRTKSTQEISNLIDNATKVRNHLISEKEMNNELRKLFSSLDQTLSEIYNSLDEQGR